MIDKEKRRNEIKRDFLAIYKECVRSGRISSAFQVAFEEAIRLDKRVNEFLDEGEYSVVSAEDEVLLSIDGKKFIYYFTTFSECPCKVKFLDSKDDEITYIYEADQILSVFTQLGYNLMGKKVDDIFNYEDEDTNQLHRVIVLGVRKSNLSINLSKDYIEAEMEHRKRK